MQVVRTVAAGDTAMPAPRVSRHERLGFADFYRAEFPSLIVLARGLCGNASADDIAQEAMLAVYRRWDEVAGWTHPTSWSPSFLTSSPTPCARLAISPPPIDTGRQGSQFQVPITSVTSVTETP
jgi:Sigma-70 region 2